MSVGARRGRAEAEARASARPWPRLIARIAALLHLNSALRSPEAEVGLSLQEPAGFE